MFNPIRKIPGEFFSTSFYVGLIKFAPGTFGSFVGILISFLVLKNFPFWFFVFLTILINFLGWSSTKIYLKAKNAENEDPKEVVIDEVGGQMVSFCLFFGLNYNLYNETSNLYLILVLNFIFFRIFDISKIFPVSYFDRRNGAFYVMADDVMAGIMSGAISFLFFKLIKLIFSY